MDRWITDSEPSLRYPIYTRANAGEVYPDPVAPLTGSLAMLEAGEAGWRDAYVRSGTFSYDEFERDRPNTIGCFGGYLYLNMSQTRIYGVRFPGLTPEQVDFQYFGEMPGIASYADEARPTDEKPEATERLQWWLDNYVFARDALPEIDDDRRQIDRLVAARPDFRDLAAQELADRARMFSPLYRRLFCRHIMISGASGVGTGTVAGVCQELGDLGMTMTLVAGIGGVDSAAPAQAMWELGRTVAASKELTEIFETGVPTVWDRLMSSRGGDAAAFLEALHDFLRDHESRGPNEWELRCPTWGTKAELVIAAVDRMRLADDAHSPAAHLKDRRTEADEAAAKVREMLAGNDQALAQFDAGLRAARLFLAARERTKTTIIKLVHEQRLAVRELGRRMVEAGHLETIEQIFMFTNEELDDFIERPEEYGAVAPERERQYLSLFELEPPFVLDARTGIPPLSEWPSRVRTSDEHASPGDVLAGIPGCPGKATGRARVVLDPGHPGALEPGDVLVAPITDPAWTPLFVPACAVIVDVGAQVSHAVIVSRELGIPCVVSVTGATRRIPDGATVTVDGTTGTVTVH